MADERQRRTSRGRPIPSYLPPSFEGLSSTSRPSDHERISSPGLNLVSDDNYELPNDPLKDIRDYIRGYGFNTIFDVLDAELQELKVQQVHQVSRQQRELRKWLQGDGPSAILSLYVQHSKLEWSVSLKESITQLFSQILSQEVSNMLKEKSLRRHLQDYKLDTDFSFDTMASTFAATMPSLSAVLHTAFTPNSQSDTVTVSSSVAPKEANDTLAPSENPQSSTSALRSGATLQNHGPGSSKMPIHNPRDLVAVPRSSAHQIQGRNLMVNTAVTILCYAKSTGVNLFQGHIGYFLYASKTPKRIIEPLHQLGLSVTYESIIQATRAMAEDSAEQLRTQWKFHIPAPFSVYDNLNYYARVRDQSLHNQPKMHNYTACYVAYNPQTRLKRMLLNSDILWQKVDELTNFDIMPTIAMKTRWADAARASINATLFRYLRKDMLKYRKNNQPVSPWEVDPIYQLPIQKTAVITLPVFDSNEARVSEITKVVRGITEQMGYTSEELKDYKIVFCGDFLTVRNTE